MIPNRLERPGAPQHALKAVERLYRGLRGVVLLPKIDMEPWGKQEKALEISPVGLRAAYRVRLNAQGLLGKGQRPEVLEGSPCPVHTVAALVGAPLTGAQPHLARQLQACDPEDAVRLVVIGGPYPYRQLVGAFGPDGLEALPPF